MRRSALFSTAPLPLLLLLGCPTGDTNIGELGETTGQADDTSSTDPGIETEAPTGASGTSTGTLETSSGSGSSSSGGPPVAVCPASSQCTLPIDCDVDYSEHCGGIRRFDAAGCPRDWCVDDRDCTGTDRCVDPDAWGIQCSFDHPCGDDDDGTCGCGFGLSCASRRHCVTADVFPGTEAGPAVCAARLDEGACEAPLPGEPPGECQWLPRGESSPNPLTCDEVTVAPYACLYVMPRLPSQSTPTPCPDGSGRVPWLSPGDGDPSPETVQMALLPNADLRVGFGSQESWITCQSGDSYGICDCICELE